VLERLPARQNGLLIQVSPPTAPNSRLTPSSIISILVWVGPWLLPRALAFLRSVRASSNPSAVRPAPRGVRLSLNLLAAVVLACLAASLPYFAPPNIFRDTGSRLAVPTNVLFNRLTAVRKGNLSPLDATLRDKFADASSSFGLLYAAYGPYVVAGCPFCSSDELSTYMTYALPSILAPHLLHIFFLGLVTSSLVSGVEGSRWRMHATMAGISITVLEIFLVLNNDYKLNATKIQLKDVDFFYWKLRIWRLLAFAGLDAVFGWVLWLTATNRWLAKPPSLYQRLTEALMTLHAMHGKYATLGRMRNAILRDDELREASMAYWAREPRIMEQIHQNREVVDAKRVALSRLDPDKLRRDAETWVDQTWAAIVPPEHRPDASGHAKTD
jgi:hypothetical protein